MIRWWITLCFTAALLAIAFYAGYAQKVIDNDKTHLVFVIAALWAIATSLSATKSKLGLIRYLADACTTLGLLGTVIGLMMLVSSVDLSAGDNMAIKEAIASMLGGIGTSLSTTLVRSMAMLHIRYQLVEDLE